MSLSVSIRKVRGVSERGSSALQVLGGYVASRCGRLLEQVAVEDQWVEVE
jgi:hypothetical protein